MTFHLFAGPCMLESRDLGFRVAEALKKYSEQYPFQFYFKASFDKANRTSIDSQRGPGLDEGLKVLQDIKNEFSLPLITDFHLPDQAEAVASVVDVLQIPAFLCRQTDILVAGTKACQKHGRALKVKKGQFLAPEDTQNIVDKIDLPKERVFLTERGTSFGYHTLIVDMASFQVMAQTGAQVVFDATHSVQRPGGEGKTTGGKREFIPALLRAACATGFLNGVFLETHPNPDRALSDAQTQWPLDRLDELLRDIKSLVLRDG